MHNRQDAIFLAIAFSLALFVMWMLRVARLKTGTDLLCLSALAAINLLSIYHRFYDATLLIIPLCCLLARPNRSSRIGLLALSAFMVPGGSMLETLKNRGLINSFLSNTDWWNGLVMAHAVWALVLLTLVLLYEMSTAAGARSELPHQQAKYLIPKSENHAAAVMGHAE